MTNTHLANKPCAEAGCDKPRVINGTGYVQTYCAEHLRLHMKEWEANRSEKAPAKPPSTRKTVCAREGCDEPRYISPAGAKHTFCRHHYNEYQRNLKAKKRTEARAVKPLTEAQKHAGFDRDETQVRARADVSKVCIIDYNTKVASFMDVVITLQCSIDGLEALPNGFDILLHGNASKGYITLERGTRPEGVRHV